MFSDEIYALGNQWIEQVYLSRFLQGYPGKPDGSGGYIYDVDGVDGATYVRMGTPESTTINIAINQGSPIDYRLRVYMERRGGQLVIAFPDPEQARLLYGRNVGAATPIGTTLLQAVAILQSCAVVTVDKSGTALGGLTVRVQAGSTAHHDWQDGSNLTTLVPTATASNQSFNMVGINSDNEVVTALTADRGLAYAYFSGSNLTTLGYADIKTVIEANPDVFWVWAFLLANGATAPDLAKQVDLRFWNMPTMVGADGSNAGVSGLVPAPAAADNLKFLRGDGTWGSGGGAISGNVLPSICEGRLTLESGAAISTTDQTAKTTIYWTPYKGSITALRDSGGTWNGITFSEISVKLTDTQTGNTSNGSAVVTALSDTSQFIVGMEVTGTGIAGGSTIASIDSGTQVTLSANATADGTGVSLTFKVPANTVLDVFGFDNSGSAKLELCAWTNDTTRATNYALQDGVEVKSGAATRKLLGTVRTGATAGQTEDSVSKRLLWNRYNRIRRDLYVVDTTNTWSYNTATWRSANAADTNRVAYVCGLQEDPVRALVQGNGSASVGVAVAVGVGVDSTNTNSAQIRSGSFFSTTFIPVTADYAGYPGIGYHYLQWLEIGNPGATVTWIGDNGASYTQSGMRAEVWA